MRALYSEACSFPQARRQNTSSGIFAEGDPPNLDEVFDDNARAFFRCGAQPTPSCKELAMRCFAIAVELTLKAHLLRSGISDDWNRVYLRHDLKKALIVAQICGLRDLPQGLAQLATRLTPFYQRRKGLETLNPIEIVETAKIVEKLICSVQAVKQQGRIGGISPHAGKFESNTAQAPRARL